MLLFVFVYLYKRMAYKVVTYSNQIRALVDWKLSQPLERMVVAEFDCSTDNGRKIHARSSLRAKCRG